MKNFRSVHNMRNELSFKFRGAVVENVERSKHGAVEKVNTAIKFSLYNDKGKGIFLSVTPVEFDDTFETQLLMASMDVSGFRILVLPLERKSDKKHTALAEQLDAFLPEWAALFREKGAQAAADAIHAAALAPLHRTVNI